MYMYVYCTVAQNAISAFHLYDLIYAILAMLFLSAQYNPALRMLQLFAC